jgi:hypothetical protein
MKDLAPPFLKVEKVKPKYERFGSTFSKGGKRWKKVEKGGFSS